MKGETQLWRYSCSKSNWEMKSKKAKWKGKVKNIRDCMYSATLFIAMGPQISESLEELVNIQTWVMNHSIWVSFSQSQGICILGEGEKRNPGNYDSDDSNALTGETNLYSHIWT